MRPIRGPARQVNGAQNNRPQRGLNENYARELLELHTLGVDGGYTQDDIVQVARALTGWTIRRPVDGGGFRFAPNLHDRESKTVLGQKIPAGGGIEDGEHVLDLLARHPSTARNIAFKLAQRFVSDAPPQSLVERAAQDIPAIGRQPPCGRAHHHHVAGVLRSRRAPVQSENTVRVRRQRIARDRC